MRGGLLSHQPVIDALNQHFVPVEVIVPQNGLPKTIKGFDFWRQVRLRIPWTRLSAAHSVILDPAGETTLAVSGCGHREPEEVAGNHQKMLSDGLRRFAALEELEDGSSARRRAFSDLGKEIDSDLRRLYPCVFDAEQFTVMSITVMGLGVAEIFKQPEAEVRRSALDHLGRLGPMAKRLIPMIAERLEDPDAVVRLAAATALGAVSGGSWLGSNTATTVELAQRWWREEGSRQANDGS